MIEHQLTIVVVVDDEVDHFSTLHIYDVPSAAFLGGRWHGTRAEDPRQQGRTARLHIQRNVVEVRVLHAIRFIEHVNHQVDCTSGRRCLEVRIVGKLEHRLWRYSSGFPKIHHSERRYFVLGFGSGELSGGHIRIIEVQDAERCVRVQRVGKLIIVRVNPDPRRLG